MIKVKVEGPGASIVSAIITKALRNNGLSTNHWTDVKPGEVRAIRADATRKGDDVSVIAMSR